MNTKVIIGVVIVLLVVVGGYFLNRHTVTNQQSNMQQMPAQNQEQKQTMPSGTEQTGSAVTVQNFAYSPATLTVKVGDKVTWTNQDSAGHSATADDGSFDTGVLEQGQSGSITFSKAGTYVYHCSVHPNMKATVIVK
jgi:plastocyanin